MNIDAKTTVTIVLALISFVCASAMLLKETIQPKLHIRFIMSDNTFAIEHATVFSWISSFLIYLGAWVMVFTLIWIMY